MSVPASPDLSLNVARILTWLLVADIDGLVDAELIGTGLRQALPLGAVVAIADLVDCIPTERLMFHETVEIDGKDFGPMPGLLGKHEYVAVEVNQRPYGDFTWGRFAWMLENIRSVDPHVKAKGHQQIWNWDEPLELAGGTLCLVHSQSEPCGTCRGYIAAGL
jgi:hypothetical protein